MQKVEIYSSMEEAKYEMERYIESGWRIHTCTMGSYTVSGWNSYQDVLVVYEKTA